jgi:cell division protein FtsB
MGWLNKKSDPVSERAQALSSEIAALEAQIKQLDDQLHRAPEHPRLRSTAVPHGTTISHTHRATFTVTETDHQDAGPIRSEPVFEEINQDRLTARPLEVNNAPEMFNDLGVRKYDLPGLLRRMRNFFHGPNTSNPKLVNYLAAGGVQGLRPLRKERRVARNRFILFSALLFIVMFGTLWWFLRN